MDLAKHWRQRAARYRLEGERHVETGEVRFPPEPAVATGWHPYVLSGKGTIYSFSVVRQVPDGFEAQAPYVLALISLAEGPTVTAQLTDCSAEDVSIGMPVEMVSRKLRDTGAEGLLVYGYKFRPQLEA